MTRAFAAPRLRIFECEGHGRYFEAYDGPPGIRNELSGYGGSFDTGADVCAAYGGRIALLYSFDDYDRACLALMEADPEGWDTSDVVPAPHLVMVRAVPLDTASSASRQHYIDTGQYLAEGEAIEA